MRKTATAYNAQMLSESQIQKLCVEYLHVMETQGVLTYWAIPNHRVSRRVSGYRAGAVDLIVIMNHGPVIFCELKKHDGKLSKEQKAFRDVLLAFKHPWHLVRSLDDLKAAIGVVQKDVRRAA